MDPLLVMDEETRRALENMARIGTVMDTNEEALQARVKFWDTNIPSAWPPVLKRGMVLHAREKSFVLKPWMPEKGAVVLCLYLPVFGGDGFVLGEIGTQDAVL